MRHIGPGDHDHKNLGKQLEPGFDIETVVQEPDQRQRQRRQEQPPENIPVNRTEMPDDVQCKNDKKSDDDRNSAAPGNHCVMDMAPAGLIDKPKARQNNQAKIGQHHR